MPLHLLGKKSWNVYNAHNIAKVKQDEAAAAAREEAEEQRMQDVDAERRIQQLRGLRVEPFPVPHEVEDVHPQSKPDVLGRERKRRRIAGEDDTARDIRFARESNALVPTKAEMHMKSKKTSDAPITDRAGHINLFPKEDSKGHAPKNAEVEAEKAKKQKDFEDQYTMRFSNAAGFKQAIGQKPWYHTLGANGENTDEPEIASKDVWGNEDPRRKERGKLKLAADDPLAAIQKGIAGVREVEKERKTWEQERDIEIKEIEKLEQRRSRKRRRHQGDDLNNFTLDASNNREERRSHPRDSREGGSRHSHRPRSRSREHDRHRSRHGHHRTLKKEARPGWEVGPGGRYSSQFAHA